MSASASRLAENRGFLFRQIAESRGGARGMLLSPAVLAQAEINLQAMTPAAVAEIEKTVDGLKALADARSTGPGIWAGAHDLRGLAGAFGMPEVGIIAGAIRLYGHGWPDGLEPDWPFLEAMTAMLSRAFHHPGELPLDVLATACEDAVALQLEREGRSVDEAEMAEIA